MPGDNEPAVLRSTGRSRNTNFNLYHEVWDGVLDIGQNVRNPQRGMVRKHFYAYIEGYEQTAHDPAMDEFCNGDHRPRHRGRVAPVNDEGIEYYATHGEVAARLSAATMQARWQTAANNQNNATVFQTNRATPLAVQAHRQDNGYCYEITLWYMISEVYISFHCYPG